MSGKQNVAYYDRVIKHTPKTQNFDALCVVLRRSGKTYADWQKERYGALYDVKTHLHKNRGLKHE